MSAFVGIDVSKASLDVAVLGDAKVRQFDNTVAGLKKLATALRSLSPTLIILEATGGYEVAALDALHAAGLPTARVNPRQARDFAKATGQLAKTDRLDAHCLARMASAVPLTPYCPAPAWQRRLGEWQHRRHQLVEMLGSERQRLAKLNDSTLRRLAEKHLKLIQTELRTLDDGIARQLKQQPSLAPTRTLKGVGQVMQATLTCSLPELGRLPGKAISKLVGVAPMARDSGQWRGQRAVWGGRADVRKTLYMAALTAIRHEPRLRDFYRGLRERGKPGKVAIVAVMRKMIIILNARMRDAMAQAQAPG